MQAKNFDIFVRHTFWKVKFVDAVSSLARLCSMSLIAYGKVCSYAHGFNFVHALLGGATTECWIWKYVQISISAPLNETRYADQDEIWYGKAYHKFILRAKFHLNMGMSLQNSKFDKICSFSFHRGYT